MSRVLLVDDQPSNLTVLERMLAPLGIATVSAGGGREALSRLADETFDLVLLDLDMPDLDGIDVLTHLRATWGPHLPVIMVTAHREREQRLRALEAGADEFLEKPIDRPILHARVKTLLALKASRDELATRHLALQALQREQREMLQFIVHDLRTPLMIAQSSVSYAGESLQTDPKDALEALSDASESIIRVNDLVSDVLSVTKLDQAQVKLDRSRVAVDPLLHRLSSLYSRKARARRVHIEANTKDVVVRADEALLRRVLENIMDNSLRHTPAEGRLGLEAEASARGVRIAISNSGPPVAVEEREAIFEKFARGTSPGSTPGAVGLGLYFCKRVIEAHGGRIHVDSTDRWPTTFVINLPGEH